MTPTDAQRNAAAVLAIMLVAMVVFFLVWLVVAVAGPQPLGDRLPGSLFLSFMAAGDFLQTTLKALPLLIGFGLNFVIPRTKPDVRFYATVVLSALGALLSIYLLAEFLDPAPAHRMWSYSRVAGTDNPPDFFSLVKTSFGGLAGWFLGILAVQLGMKLGQ